MNTLITGYTAVNATRDRVVTGRTDEGVPLTLAHRRVMYRNDWIPLKMGLAAISLAFSGFIVYLPELAQQPELLRSVCYLAALLPFGSFLGFFILGFSDRRLMRTALSQAETEGESRGVQ